MSAYTPEEMMIVAAARSLVNGAVCLVGPGHPSAAVNLARLTHAPDLVLIYDSGIIGTRPPHLPLSVADEVLVGAADTVVPVPELFRYWLQGGRIDVGFLGAAQIDKFGNLNSTVIGSYDKPRVRLPGAGAAPEIAMFAKEVFLVAPHAERTLVEKLDYVTTKAPPRGPVALITDLGVLRPAPETHELVLFALHPGVTEDDVRARTGWKLEVAPDVITNDPPTDTELEVLRAMQARTKRAHSRPDPS